MLSSRLKLPQHGFLIKEETMRRVVGIAAFVLLGGLTISVGTVAGATERFTGQNSGTTAEFAFDGPWTLDWEATSDYPLAAEFEMRLLDAKTGRVVGTILQIEGAASGLRLFTESGTFRIEVIASYVDWTLEVEPVSAAVAAQLQQGTKQAPTLEDRSRETLRHIPGDVFSSWRVEDESNLLLFGENGKVWRAEFSVPCPGLESAKALSFMSPGNLPGNEYDSILLDDGTRCYFNRVIPTVIE